jgi:transposase-like protein
MAHSLQIKNKAVELRKTGYSIKEIARILNIAVSTSSTWLRETPVGEEGKNRMKEQASLHRYKMSLRWKQKRADDKLSYQKQAQVILDQISFTPPVCKLICAILFWAEGSKTNRRLEFTNSDPSMIALFIRLLRQSYDLDETKFRVCLHLHDYHDAEEMLDFWSRITKIPLNQFIKPYRKPHTGLRKKKDYKGCASVRYYNSQIACQLEALYNRLSEK